METYHGHIRTPADAIKIFEACRLGLLQRVRRRLSEKERQDIKSGSVFVWDEREAGMRRWTDGKSWSASRVSGSFLTYREMEGKRGGQFFLPLILPKQTSNVVADNARVSDEDIEEGGPDGYRYKPDGLMKQSFSITTSTGQHLHLISYYSRSHSSITELCQPISDPQLRHIVPVKGMYPESTLHDSYGPALTYSLFESTPHPTKSNIDKSPQYCNKISSPNTRSSPLCHQYPHSLSHKPWPTSNLSALSLQSYPINTQSPSLSLSNQSHTTQYHKSMVPQSHLSSPSHPPPNSRAFDNSYLPQNDYRLLTPPTNDRSCNQSPQTLHLRHSDSASSFSHIDHGFAGNLLHSLDKNPISSIQPLQKPPSATPPNADIKSIITPGSHILSPEITVVSSIVPSISSLVEATDYVDNCGQVDNISPDKLKRSLPLSRNQVKTMQLHDIKINLCEDQRAIRVLDRKFCV